MNLKKSTFFIACLLIVFMISCGQKNTSSEASQTETMEAPSESAIDTTKQGKEFTSKYICPMHCEGSGSEAEGQCPVCGMDYVLNRNLEEAEGENHEGHDH